MEPRALTSGLCMTQYLPITTTTKSSETKAGDFELLLKPWRGYARGRGGGGGGDAGDELAPFACPGEQSWGKIQY